MIKKIINALVLLCFLFGCDLFENPKSTQNVSDDNITIEYSNKDNVLITNKTSRNIVIHFVMTNDMLSIVLLVPPSINDTVDLLALSESTFTISGYDESSSNDFRVSYFFVDDNDTDGDTIPDETFSLQINE